MNTTRALRADQSKEEEFANITEVSEALSKAIAGVGKRLIIRATVWSLRVYHILCSTHLQVTHEYKYTLVTTLLLYPHKHKYPMNISTHQTTDHEVNCTGCIIVQV